MSTISPKSYLENLNWRYATKQYDTSKKLSPEQIETLLEVLRLSPSSTGAQPWKFIVVENPEIRQQLRAAAWGQPQVTDASHFIIFAVKKGLPQSHIDRVVEVTAQQRGQKVEDLQGYKEMLMGSIGSRNTPEALIAWNKEQAHIALGFLLSAAAQLHIDASPMGGFDPAKFDEILELDKEGLTTAVICGLGFRSPDDKYAQAAKARLPKEEVIEWRK
jgi:nitroreductase